jgi:hypothetical protein
MSDDPINNRWRELSWRRRLTDAEQADLGAWLTAHPEARADWEAEAGLNAGLSRLPDVPVPGNFTARVLQAVEREAAARPLRPEGGWLPSLWRGWLPKLAFGAVVVGVGLVSFHEAEAVHRKKLAESVAVVSAVSALPSPSILKDFDAIQALNQAPPPDEQLLAVLQ